MQTTRRTKRSAGDLFRLCLVDGSLDDGRVRTVIDAAVASRRRGITTVLTRLQRLVRLDRERHSARVESAVPLSDAMRADVEAIVTRLGGPGIRTSFIEDAALVGGIRITVGSVVYDGSVRGRLDAIGRTL